MFQKPILVNDVRIFRPGEMGLFLTGISKAKYRIMFEALLYTGARYIEMQRLQRHHDWFDHTSNFIHLPSMAMRKKKQMQKERHIRLNKNGADKVALFLELGKKLPTYITWRENLVRWASKVGMDTSGLSVKVSRKTWECWLVYYYPHDTEKIYLSQGHTQMTALHNYLSMPFSNADKEEMGEFVEGWI